MSSPTPTIHPPARVEAEAGLPVIRVPAGTPAITPEMVRRALDED